MTPPPETYSDCLDWLYARNQFAMKLGLENINALLDRLHRPDRGMRFLHVAGTNGKGSVCANLAAMLRAAGFARVGLYTSPHLVSFRERILVDGEPIEKEWILAWMRGAMPALEELNATYFECVTAMALAYFRERACEAVVLETGLGGRLDATNAVTPEVTAVTSISLDHTHILGNTVEEIWREKIAILKPGVPMVVREDRPALLRELEANAAAAGSPVFKLGDHPCRRAGGILTYHGRYGTCELPGDLRAEDHQVENLGLSLLALECFLRGPLPPASALVPALRAARVPGRTQLLEEAGLVPVLLDGAHNPGGMEALSRFVRARFPGRRVAALFAVMRDKDYAGVFRAVRGLASEVLYAPLEAWYPRALRFAELTAALRPDERSALREFSWEGAPPGTSAVSPRGAAATSQGGSAFSKTAATRVAGPDSATPADAPPPATGDTLESLLRPRPGGPELLVICGSLYLLGRVIPRLLPYYSGLAPFRRFEGES